jgi:hypothetical protein
MILFQDEAELRKKSKPIQLFKFVNIHYTFTFYLCCKSVLFATNGKSVEHPDQKYVGIIDVIICPFLYNKIFIESCQA